MRVLVLVVVLCGCNMSPVQIKRAIDARQSISKKVDEHQQLQEMLRNDLQAFFKDTEIRKYEIELESVKTPSGYEIAAASGKIRSGLEYVEVNTSYVKVDGKWVMAEIFGKTQDGERYSVVFDQKLVDIVVAETELRLKKHRFKVN